jgi:HPt (histidine-containing phosphotransfer) domain-containing protein
LKNINYDIQASEKIISILSRSKLEFEKILNDLDNIFIIINEKFEVLKCNSSYSQTFSADVKPLRSDFLESIQKEYQQNIELIISKVVEEKVNKDIEFKLTDNRLFYSTITSFEPIRKEEGRLIKITGVDITSLREAETQMMEIMGVVNLGIIFIDKYNNILPGYSDYSKVILEDHDLIGKDINSIFFKKATSIFTTSESQALNNLTTLFGSSELEFRTNSFLIPESLVMESKITDNSKKVIKFTIEPILQENKVDRYMIILQDVTASKGGNETSFSEDVNQLLSKLDKEKENTSSAIEEINNLIHKITTNYKASSITNIKGPLHSLKGVLRVLGLSYLAQMVHSCEDLSNQDSFSASEFTESLNEINSDWDKIFKIYGFLTRTSEDRTSNNFLNKVEKLNQNLLKATLKEKLLKRKKIQIKSLEKLYPFIEATVVQNVIDFDYQVDFETDLCQGYVHSEIYQALNHSLIHMINNSFAHGFDKNGSFLISIRCSFTSNGSIEIIYKDDGNGINIKKLKEVIAKKEGTNSISNLSDIEIAEYIFKEDLSTKDEVTEVSGRGVGLAAAYSDVTELDGNFDLVEVHKGCSFKITIPIWPEAEVSPTALSSHQLTNLLELLEIKKINLPISFFSFNDLFRFFIVLDFLKSKYNIENLTHIKASPKDHQDTDIERHLSLLLGEPDCKIMINEDNQMQSLILPKLNINNFTFPNISISVNTSVVKDHISFFEDFFGENQSIVKVNQADKENNSYSNIYMKSITLNFLEDFLELQLQK